MLRYFSLDEAAAAEAAGVDIASVPPDVSARPPLSRGRAVDLLDDRPDASRGGHARRLPALVGRRAEPRRRRGLLLGVAPDRRVSRAGVHSGGRPCRPGARPGDLDRRLPGRGQDRRERAPALRGGQGLRERGRLRGRDRGRSRGGRHRDQQAASASCSGRWARAPAATPSTCSPTTSSATPTATSPATPRSIAISAAEYARLQTERVAAFREFVSDVESGAYPEEGHLVRMAPEELEAFPREARVDAGDRCRPGGPATRATITSPRPPHVGAGRQRRRNTMLRRTFLGAAATLALTAGASIRPGRRRPSTGSRTAARPTRSGPTSCRAPSSGPRTPGTRSTRRSTRATCRASRRPSGPRSPRAPTASARRARIPGSMVDVVAEARAAGIPIVNFNTPDDGPRLERLRRRRPALSSAGPGRSTSSTTAT